MAQDLWPLFVVMGTRGRTGMGEIFDPARVIRRDADCLSCSFTSRPGKGIPSLVTR